MGSHLKEVYSEVNPMFFNKAYFQESMFWTADIVLYFYGVDFFSILFLHIVQDKISMHWELFGVCVFFLKNNPFQIKITWIDFSSQ